MKLRKYAILVIALLVVVAVVCFAVGCEKHVHSYTWEQTTAPTCEGEGVETGTCECGDVITRPVAAAGHVWGEYEITKNPTSDEAGEVKATCLTDNSHTHTAALPVLSDEGYTVTPDGKDMYDTYSYTITDEVTGAEGQTVSFEVYVHQHSYVWEIVTEPTCLTEGLKRGTCSNEYCEDVCEESIDVVPHAWAEEVEILAEPTFEGTGLAQVKCSYDAEENHVHTYVLPALNTYWADHSEEDDANEVVYNGWAGAADEEDAEVLHYTLTINDPFIGYDCGPKTYEVVIDVAAADHVHVYSEYAVVEAPGAEAGWAEASCLICPDHEPLLIELPKIFGSNAGYEFGEEIDGKIGFTYTSGDDVVTGSIDAPTCISIKVGTLTGNAREEVYSDGDTIQLNAGDVKQAIHLYTVLIGKTFANVTITVTDLDGNPTVPFVTDGFMGTEANNNGVCIDKDYAYTSSSKVYYRSFYPDAYLLTLDAGNGLKSTFTVEPILLNPSSSNPLSGQVWNGNQNAWNYISGSASVYVGADLYIGAGSTNKLVDCSVTATVENADGEDVTADVLSEGTLLGGKDAILFASFTEGVYKVTMTSTKVASHSFSFEIEVKGQPLPSQLFNGDYYYTTSTNTEKYTLTFTEFNNDDESMVSTGVATLVIESNGTTTIPFTYTYSTSGCEFLPPLEYGRDIVLSMNNSYKIVLSYCDEFEEVDVELLLEKVALFSNNLVGTYSFKYNPDPESPETKVSVTVNQGGIYKLNIEGSGASWFVVININKDVLPDFVDNDYRLGKFMNSGATELEIILNEGDTIVLYNCAGWTSTVHISYEGAFNDVLEGEYAFNGSETRLELTANRSGSYKLTVNTSYLVINVNKDEDPEFASKDYMVGKFLGSGNNELLINVNEGDKLVFVTITGDTIDLSIEYAGAKAE